MAPGRRYRARTRIGDTFQDVEITVGPYATSIDARKVFEAQYGRDRIITVDEVRPTGDRISSSTAPPGTSRHRHSNSGGGLLSLIIFILAYFPILGPCGLAGYFTYRAAKDWHPVLMGMAIVSSCLLVFSLLALIVSRIPRAASLGIGFISYFAVIVYLKRDGWAIDWIWVTAIAVLFGIFGAASFATCHDALSRLKTHIASSDRTSV